MLKYLANLCALVVGVVERSRSAFVCNHEFATAALLFLADFLCRNAAFGTALLLFLRFICLKGDASSRQSTSNAESISQLALAEASGPLPSDTIPRSRHHAWYGTARGRRLGASCFTAPTQILAAAHYDFQETRKQPLRPTKPVLRLAKASRTGRMIETLSPYRQGASVS